MDYPNESRPFFSLLGTQLFGLLVLAALDRFVRDSYAFLPVKATDWNAVISALMPRARATRDNTAWLHLLEEALDALYDGHAQLNTNAPDYTRGLIVDVRSNAGVDTVIARPIIGRFITARTQYAWMTRRDGPVLGLRRPEFVDARGPWTYSAPGVVLVDRFSVSMAEGFAMARSGLGRARIAGTRMARLGAAVGRIELPYSRIAVQVSTEPVYAIDGTPRWELEPDVVVNPQGRADRNDPFIAAAIEEIERGRPPEKRDALQESGTTSQIRAIARRRQDLERDVRGVESRDRGQAPAGARPSNRESGKDSDSEADALAAAGGAGSQTVTIATRHGRMDRA